MSNDLPVLTSLTESSTDVPVSAGQVENYVLLLVLLSVFAGGMLVLLSLLLLFCHRCCLGGRRYSRASDDPEKTNTTYAEDSQPTQEITIRLDESDALSASSCHDGEPERFVFTGSTGRRVSFNESALYEQEKSTQDKGRRYTLTEGDFHHLKKARLTHLHLPPAPCDLKILTIMECESTESSSTNINESGASKLPLTIYQPGERQICDWMGQSLSGGLPGDPHHSIILDQGCRKSSSAMKPQHTHSQTMEALGDKREAEGSSGQRGESLQSLGQTSVLHFFSKLRRHASLEGAGPYFRRWKFDTSQRAASLDAKGSPKRKPFQRQRAASENTEHTEDDSSPLCDDAFESFPHTPIQTAGFQSLSAESLPHPAMVPTSLVFLKRVKLEAMVEVGDGTSPSRREELPMPLLLGQRGEEATANGKEPEKETEFGADAETGAAEDGPRSAEGVDLFGAEQDAVLQERFEDLLRENKDAEAGSDEAEVRKLNGGNVEDGDEMVLGAEGRRRTESFMGPEAPPSLYRDIWSLRASLEQYASSDQSSTDRESIRSDADSVSSFGGAGARSGLGLSQELDDEVEGEGEAEGLDGGASGALGVDSEVGNGAGGESEGGNRKLLQMDSGYASIEAPSRAPEDMRLFGTPGVPRGKTASERRLFFTNSGRKGSVCESVDARLFQEELEDQIADTSDGEEMLKHRSITPQEPYKILKSLHPQKPSESQLMSPLMKSIPQPSSPHRARLRHRDYSIDEKTDALFNEFLRHDPRFDQQDSPIRSRHRSRVHLRKQWQRHKQYSDPGSASGGRYSPSLERQRFTPLRRGDSAGYPLDTRYHSTLSRIASAADEEASEVAASEEAAKERAESKEQPSEGAERTTKKPTEGSDQTKTDSCRVSPSKERPPSTTSAPMGLMDPRVDNRNNNSSQAILSESSLKDKLVASVEERLYGGLQGAERQGGSEHVLIASHTASPGFSPT